MLLAIAEPLTHATDPYRVGYLTAVGETIYFSFRDPEHGLELWKSDGTPSGTQMVIDLNPGRGDSGPVNLAPLGNLVLFGSGSAGLAGPSLWKSDGTAAGTTIVAEVSMAFEPGLAITLGSQVIFDSSSFLLWRSDGTEQGTRQIATPGAWLPYKFFKLGSKVLFGARPSVGSGALLWATDATDAGTVQLVSDSPSDIHWFVGFKRVAYVGVGNALMRTDATPAGTRVIAQTTGRVEHLTVVGDRLFFSSLDDSTPTWTSQLWQSDGTAAGTAPLAVQPPGVNRIHHLASVNGSLLAIATTQTAYVLLRFDGGSSAFTPLAQYARVSPFSAVMIGGNMLYEADSRVYQTDGTVAGTVPLHGSSADVYPQSLSSSVNVGDSVFFLGGDGTGLRLWRYTPDASISGVVFNDRNRNGKVESGEPRLSGFKVFIDSNRNGRHDSSESFVRTNSRGEYRLGDLPPVSARVRIVSVEGWGTTRAAAEFAVDPGEANRFHFAMYPTATISGVVFADNNRDRIRSATEPGLSQWRVFVDSDDDGILEPGEKSVLSDVNGNWSFSDLPAGTHVIRVVQPANYRLTTPRSGYFVVTIAAGQSKGGLLFGQKRIALISG